MANSLKPASRAAPATVAIGDSAAHPEHQLACQLAATRKIKSRSVSTVNFVMRFGFFIDSARARQADYLFDQRLTELVLDFLSPLPGVLRRR